MRVISSTDLSREGNDCYIHEEISLVEQFGIYAIICCNKIDGWAEREEVLVVFRSTEKKKAIRAYKGYGGKLDVD